MLVETAMFAAVGGLAFSIAAVLKLQGYMGYLLPMPIVLSAIRSGPAVARKTTVATAFLLFGARSDSGSPAKGFPLEKYLRTLGHLMLV